MAQLYNMSCSVVKRDTIKLRLILINTVSVELNILDYVTLVYLFMQHESRNTYCKLARRGKPLKEFMYLDNPKREIRFK